MTDFKNTVYWKIYADVFAFHKKFAEVREDDPYWSAVTNEASALYRRYEDTPENEFVKSLTLCVLDELERLDKERRLRNNGKHD